MANEASIFQEYFHIPDKLIDRLIEKNGDGIDVIIPVRNTNPLWERNLYNYYERIPVKSLLIGDAGCTDKTIEIGKRFPRVKIYDHSNLKTLGASIRDLIKAVETEWFIYLHSDVYLPENWYDSMCSHKNEYDWFECNRRATILFEYDDDISKYKRALSGSQFGKKAAFDKIIPRLEDDFLYRNEDIVLAELIEQSGCRYGKIKSTFHYHQAMNRRGELEPKYSNISINREPDLKWEINTYTMQVKGIIKYLSPKKHYLRRLVNQYVLLLLERNAWNWAEFKKWVKKANSSWAPHVTARTVYKERIIKAVKYLLRK